jgi:amino acid adenylation domain-containing protein
MAQSPDMLNAELAQEPGKSRATYPQAESAAASAAPDDFLQSDDGGDVSQQGDVLRKDLTEEYPCSLGQRRFWILDQLEPGNPSLNVAVRWRLEGAVSSAQLESAFQHIIARHAVLRTRIATVDGEPVQVVEPRMAFRIPVIDLSQLPKADAEREALRIAKTEARASFDLSVAPLIRVTLVRLREGVAFLLVTAHHTICDGWSIGLLTRELTELCAAEHAGRAAALPELPVSYGDYAAWQTDWARSADLEPETEFWVNALRGAQPFEVHPERPRPPVQTTNGEIESTLLDRGITNRLSELSKRQGCTMFMVSLAALMALLHRYTGAQDICVGTQVAGRDDTDLEDLIGMFINTLVLRVDVSGDPAFPALCERVRNVVTDAFENQQMPLEKLIEILKPQRDRSRNPLFSVNFIFQRSFIRNASGGSFELMDMPSVSAGAMYDLNFFMVERPDGWRASCEFNTDLFDRATIARLLGHFTNILRALGQDESRTISQLPLLSEAERQDLVVGRNDTAREYPKHLTVTHLFDLQARRTPEAIAVVCGDERLRYQELEAAANRLAHALLKRGLTPSSRVGVFLDRSADLVIALLAVLKAGCAYIPLDPIYPKERLRHVIEDSRLSVLISNCAYAARLPENRAPLVLLDTDVADIAGQGSELPEYRSSGGDIAYVMYTSGSTGKPKGVQIPHIALTNFLCSMQREPGITDKDALLAVTTISFDIAALEMFLPLVSGAKLVIAREDEAADGRELLRLMTRHSISVLQATPVTWQLLLESGWQGQPALKMLCGGEALPRKLAEKLLDCGGELWNMYGPTETTIWSSAMRVTRGEQTVPVGPPISNTQFYVVDALANPVPIGVPGELVIGGDGVARGYVNLPKLTAERFPTDHFRNVADARLYRTGDLVRARMDGTFEFLGRADHQIKLRGYRIELGEIESAILGHPDVAEAVAHAGKARNGDGAIWAYVVPKHTGRGPEQLIADLQQRLQRALPAYMQPASIAVLASLPRTPNGKVDRKLLPEPREVQQSVAAPPVTDLERRLAAVWCSVLGLQSVDRTANFFEIGGHSVLAARLAARIEAQFGRRLSLATLFKSPSIEEQARVLGVEQGRQFDFRQVVKLQPNGSKPPIIAINNTGIFYVLSRRLGSDQPFTCLQLFDPANRDVPLPDTVEALASEYVRLIRSVQQNGPYALVGWCVAGALTFETARQLAATGQKVSMLAMVDTWAPGHLKRLGVIRGRLTDYSYRGHLIMREFRCVLRREMPIGTFISNRVLVKTLKGLFSRAAPVSPPSADDRELQSSPEAYDQWLQRYLERNLKQYQPKPYPGRLTLLRSGQEPRGLFIDNEMGWGQFAQEGVEVVMVEGDHFTVFSDPGVRQIAATIARLLGT